MHKKIIAVIPARGGSKGVPRKNMRCLSGKPLLQYTIDEARKSDMLSKIIVTTEDREIKDYCENQGVQTVQRPQELALDTSPVMDAVFHAIQSMADFFIPDIVVLLQCTSPFRKKHHINEALQFYLNHFSGSETLISVALEEHPPYWLNQIKNGYLSDFLEYNKELLNRRQDFEQLYRKNGAIYISTPELLQKYKSFQSDKTLPYVMDYLSSLDIDTEDDLRYAEFLMERIFDNKYPESNTRYSY